MTQLELLEKEICPLCGGKYGGHKGIYVSDNYNETVIDGVSVHLTRRESQTLAALVQVYPRVARKGFIMDYVYGMGPEVDEPEEKVIDVFACKLRKVLKPSGYDIKSVRGVGFKLVEEDISDGPRKQAA